MNELELIKGCLQNNREAQKLFYKTFAPRMYGVCLRYVRNRMEADDILQDSFIKIFEKLETFRFEGSLEGWIRRVIVNTAINYIRRKANFQDKEMDIETVGDTDIIEDEATANLSKEDLMKMIQELPVGKRTVFNLYAYEGYSHKEIADMLGITESTSKTQYLKAKLMLKEKIEKSQKAIYENAGEMGRR